MKQAIERLKNEIGETLFWMCEMDCGMMGYITRETVECFNTQGCVFPEELKKFVK